MGRAWEEALATLTGLVALLVFGGVFMAAANPRIMAALLLDDRQSFIVMITAAAVFVGAIVTVITTVIGSALRRAR